MRPKRARDHLRGWMMGIDLALDWKNNSACMPLMNQRIQLGQLRLAADTLHGLLAPQSHEAQALIIEAMAYWDAHSIVTEGASTGE
ncbi:MAG: hypothetical protein M3281_01735 [Chloroflexota bacterium]|nr:hypothetical protein [Chloroflexota bacterium]